MLSRFFGTNDKSAESAPKEAQDTRGFEVVEDDPDTAWSMWDSSLAEQDSKAPQSPVDDGQADSGVIVNSKPIAAAPVEVYLETAPMGLEEMSVDQRKDRALEVVELHHRRIANTIRTLWGYKECGIYINKLIMAGGDGMGHARVGFNQEAVQAMLALSDIHDAQFGAPDAGGGLGLSI